MLDPIDSSAALPVINPLHAEPLFSNPLAVQRTDSLGGVCTHSSERNLFWFYSTLMDFHRPGLVGKIRTKRIHPGSSQLHRHIRATSRSSPNYSTVPRNGTTTQFHILVRLLAQIQQIFTIQTALQSSDPSASFDVHHACAVPKGKSPGTLCNKKKLWTKKFAFTLGRDFRVHLVAAQWILILSRRTLYPRKDEVKIFPTVYWLSRCVYVWRSYESLYTGLCTAIQRAFTLGRDFRVHLVAAQWILILSRRTLYPRKDEVKIFPTVYWLSRCIYVWRSYESLYTGLYAIQRANFLRVNSYVVDQVMHKVRVNSYSARKGLKACLFTVRVRLG